MTELQRISAAAWEVADDRRTNRIERLEALRILCACRGLIVGDVDEKWLSAKQVVQLRDIRRRLVEKVLRRKERKRKANRRAYLRRQIRTLEAQTEGETSGTD